MNVQQMAREALAAEERPAREAAERARRAEEKREAKKRERRYQRDKKLLANSPIGLWFPGVVFEPSDHEGKVTVFQSEGPHHIHLAIDPEGYVYWAEQGWIDEGGALGARRRHGWKLERVESAADVGRQVQRIDAIMASMPDHLP